MRKASNQDNSNNSNNSNNSSSNTNANNNAQNTHKKIGKRPYKRRTTANRSSIKIRKVFLVNGVSGNENADWMVDNAEITRDKNHHSALDRAVIQGDLSALESLLSANPNLDILEENEFNKAIDLAAEYGHVDIIKRLVVAGADWMGEYSTEFTPFQRAIWHGKVEAVNYFLTMPEIKNNAKNHDNKFAVFSAFAGNQKYIAYILIKNGFGLIKDQNNAELEFKLFALNELASGKPFDRTFIEQNGITKLSNTNPETHRGVNCSERVVKEKGYSALDIGIINSTHDLNTLLLDNRELINRKGLFGLTALHWAILNQNEKAVNLLMGQGADPSAISDDLWTPLHFAALSNNSAIYRMVTESFSKSDNKKALLNPKGLGDWTPLHIAIWHSNLNILAIMQNDHNIDFESLTQQGNTPKMLADKKSVRLNLPDNMSQKIDQLSGYLEKTQLDHEMDFDKVYPTLIQSNRNNGSVNSNANDKTISNSQIQQQRYT